MDTETDIQRFYRNKTIFLTGGTGFLGKAFIEKLLRVTEVSRIYLLTRSKRGKDINERITDIFKDALYEKLLLAKPDAPKKIIPMTGDCSFPALGLSEKDLQLLYETVDIVVHSAATVRFDEPLYNALAINVRATVELIDIARNMKNLKAFLHISSAFSNCILAHVDECFYAEKLSITASKALQIMELFGPEQTNRLWNELKGDFPNTYTYTKALAEEAILSHGGTLPISIFRPGIVISTVAEPVPGWIDNLNGPMGMLFAAVHGIMRVVFVCRSANATFVPVDYCANEMLACTWQQAKEANESSCCGATSKIYNLVPDADNVIKWADTQRAVEVFAYSMPPSRMLWYPFLIQVESKLLCELISFFIHTIPGYIFDFILLLLGKKRRMVRTYQKMHRQMSLLDIFKERNWSFSTLNTQRLWQSLSSQDQQLFTFDMRQMDWFNYFNDVAIGVRLYLVKEPPETIPKGLQLMKRLLILHRILQLFIYGGGLLLFIWIFANIREKF